MPDLTSGPAAQVWRDYFSAHRPLPLLVRNWVLRLHRQKQHDQVVACLKEALIAGQSQPWMYEVLALSLEITGAPREEVERVAHSFVDFGAVDFATMMYAGAYLTRFQRDSGALTMYRQSSRLLPEQSEPYLLGLPLAVKAQSTDDIVWAATGILNYSWGPHYRKHQQDAENALLEEERRLRRGGELAAADRVRTALTEARQVDLRIRVEWTGAADVDLEVSEPGGSACSVVTPLTPGGGQHLHDGIGPGSENSYEEYVCPRAFAGPYRIAVRVRNGTVVGNRVQLTAVTEEGTPGQHRIVKSLALEAGVATLTVDLPRGRRTQLRELSLADDSVNWNEAELAGLPGSRVRDPRAMQALEEFNDRLEQEAAARPPRAGAVGYAPVITVLPDGATMSATAIVSADRRYVKIAVQPIFNTITDVFTFSFLQAP